MKIKVIQNNINIRKHFFLLMIAPLLIGLMISLTNLAHAEWETQADPLLHKSPKNQGWQQVQTHHSPSMKQKTEANS